MIKTTSIFLLLICNSLQAADFGMISDFSGDINISRNGQPLATDLGVTLQTGDQINLGKAAELRVITYKGCREWKLTGTKQVTIATNRLKGATMVSRLPICYRPESFTAKNTEFDAIGGYVVRSNGDYKRPMDPLVQVARKGQASTSILLTLVMHDIKQKDYAQANIHLRALKQKIPNSKFVQQLARYIPK